MTASLQHQPLRGSLFMLLSVAGFTANALLLKELSSTRQVDPWLALVVRAGIGLTITTVLFAPSGALHVMRSFQSWLLASRGVLGVGGTAAYYLTIAPLGAGKATLIGNTWCVFAAIMAAFILHEHLGIVKILGILLAFAGLALLTGVEAGALALLGKHELLALAGALMAATVIVVIRQLTRTETSATIFASQCVYGLLIGIPVVCMRFQPVHGMDIALLAAAGLCATIGQLTMTEGFRFLSVAAGGAWQMTVPLATTLGSIMLFSESFTTSQILGAALVLWGSFQTVAIRKLPAPKTSSS